MTASESRGLQQTAIDAFDSSFEEGFDRELGPKLREQLRSDHPELSEAELGRLYIQERRQYLAAAHEGASEGITSAVREQVARTGRRWIVQGVTVLGIWLIVFVAIVGLGGDDVIPVVAILTIAAWGFAIRRIIRGAVTLKLRDKFAENIMRR
jgi:hypothetical protein